MDETGYTCAASAFSTDIIDFKVPGETVCALVGLGSGTNSGCEERTEQEQTFDEWLKDVKEACYANMECCDEPEWSMFSTINDAIELYRSGESGYGCKAIDHAAEEERRDVARKLRELCDEDHGEAGIELKEIEDALGVDSILPFSYDPVDVNTLADLIEPEPERTCRPVCVDREDQNGVMHHLFHRCSECGHDLPYEAELGHCNFCPNCGAKVVHDAD